MNATQEAQFQALLGRSRAVMKEVESRSPITPSRQSGNSASYGGGYSPNVKQGAPLGEVDLDYSGDGEDVQYVDRDGNPVDYSAFGSERYNHISGDVNVTPEMAQMAMRNSALGPIFEDIARNPANARNPEYNGSVLDTLNIQLPPKKQRIREQVVPQAAPVSVDYALIKTIVTEQLNEFKKSMLVESVSQPKIDNVVALTVDSANSKFRMVTAEGKIYDISLTYVGDMKKD